MYRVFEDRRAAGRALVPELQRCDLADPIILGLPRGGVPLAYEIAVALRAPLDTIVVRKLGVPSQPELAFGAIASGNIRVINDDVVGSLFSLDADTMEQVANREMHELRRRERLYRLDRRLTRTIRRDAYEPGTPENEEGEPLRPVARGESADINREVA